MTAILRLESRNRVKGALILTAIFAVLSAFYFSVFPGFAEDAEDVAEAFPEWMFEFFGLDALHTLEGFIAAEIYSFFWVVLVGIYFAALGAGMIAADVQSRRMDLTLSNPVSRESVLLQKFASLWVPLCILNIGLPLVVFAGAMLIGESIDLLALAMLHILSIPYFLVCAAIGVLASVAFDRARSARATAIGAILLLWLVEGVSNLAEDFEWVGYLTPSRYYDETAILVHEEFAVADALILLGATVVLLGIATVVFVRQDL